MTDNDHKPDHNEALSKLASKDLTAFKKYNPAIITAPRLQNKVWRNLVKSFQEKNMPSEEIIKKILDYDEWIEQGKLTEEQIKKHRNL